MVSLLFLLFLLISHFLSWYVSTAGIVFGALGTDGKIDQARMKLVRQLCTGMILTFHRAFDVCEMPQSEALEQVIALKCDRLLTSAGPQSNVLQNLEALALLQRQAGDRITVVAAAGITPESVYSVITGSNVRAVHAGSSVTAIVTTTGRSVHMQRQMEDSPSNKPSSSSLSPSTADKLPDSESFVEVDKTELNSPSPRSRLVQELVTWTCVQEALVHALFLRASEAVVHINATAAPVLAEAEPVAEGSGLDSSYIHL